MKQIVLLKLVSYEAYSNIRATIPQWYLWNLCICIKEINCQRSLIERRNKGKMSHYHNEQQQQQRNPALLNCKDNRCLHCTLQACKWYSLWETFTLSKCLFSCAWNCATMQNHNEWSVSSGRGLSMRCTYNHKYNTKFGMLQVRKNEISQLCK